MLEILIKGEKEMIYSCKHLFAKGLDKSFIFTSGFSIHSYERNERMKKIKEIAEGEEIIDAFIVDRGHKDGDELHFITDKGIIYIFNREKYIREQQAFITALIARPQQVKRYYEMCDMDYPQDVVMLCLEHERKEYNKI